VKRVLVMMWMLMLVSAASAPQRVEEIRFGAVDVFVDSKGERLGAWQVEVKVVGGEGTIVGVEGGEAGAFRGAPYYDPKALAGGRIIVAAFSTAGELPTGETRVARLHLQMTGEGKRAYVVRMMAAADGDGQRILASARVMEVR
jgi:hypothetical protein